jgi:glutaredoxin
LGCLMFMIYGVSDCPHCLRAQALCMEKDIDYAWVMMDWSKQYREYIKSSWKWKTYPIITKMNFDEDGPEEFLVGGFDELKIELLSAEE